MPQADPRLLEEWLDERVARLGEAGIEPASAQALRPLLLLSDYAYEQLRRRPEWAVTLDAPPAQLVLDPSAPNDWPAALRQFRHRHSLALLAREAAGAPLDAALRHSSWMADHAILAALGAVEGSLATAHGRPRDARGAPLQLCVLALGKLGGGELNFSSDIDLVFAFAEAGLTDGPRALEHEAYFQRVGQKLIQLLGEVTADGFGFRVDMRLRPFGQAGRLALSFAAMEQYYQREGRDWERYAWIKARPINAAEGAPLMEIMRPFIYRRYLDYTAFDGLRAMKAMIEAEVNRRDLQDHLKLGPGGIREVEFVVQLHQMIRGGREPALRAQGTLPAMQSLVAAGYLDPAAADRLQTAYRHLRRVENRLQMLRDEQVHELPGDDFLRQRLARGLGMPDWDALSGLLAAQRAVVREEFSRVFEVSRRPRTPQLHGLAPYWRQLADEPGKPPEPPWPGAAEDPETAHIVDQLVTLANAALRTGLSAASRERLDRVAPALLALALEHAHSGQVVERGGRLLAAILRRPAYLALLEEQPAALRRLIEVLGGSALLAEQVIEHPLLLDDLLDARVDLTERSLEELALASASATRHEDLEQALLELNELRRSVGFRIALGHFLGRQSAVQTARQLADLAEAVLQQVLRLALRSLREAHGDLPGHAADAGIAVIGYGSLGGRELGFTSDLDLVFLTDPASSGLNSDGPRPLEGLRYQQRAVQKLLSLIGTLTSAGRLYDVDLRLRPDGAKGLLLSSCDSFSEYQRSRAWTWEHQALVRARPVAGSAAVAAEFRRIRHVALARPGEAGEVLLEVARMRARMRGELDRGDAMRFDLKQGRGGLVDIEFLLQACVLTQAAAHPDWLQTGETESLIDLLAVQGPLDLGPGRALVDQLREAHELLLARAMACTLDRRPRLVAMDAAVQQARDTVASCWRSLRLGDAATDMAATASEPPSR